jgi:hypothetical protein
MAILLWFVALGNLALTLLATSKFWIGPPTPTRLTLTEPTHESRPRFLFSGKSRRAFALCLALILLLAAFMAGPRLSQSFWGDEDYTMRLHLHGYFKRSTIVDDTGQNNLRPYFRRLPWLDTMWGYRTTNNHFLYTILGRSSLSAWHKITGADYWTFREEVLRILPFLSGLAGLAVWMLLLRRLGFPRLAILTGLILALHPWFIRYLSEGRGYGFIFLLLPLNLWIIKNALEQGRWRWWLLHALTQFLMLYSWPGMAFHVLGLNLLLPLALWKLRGPTIQGKSQLARWAVANLLTLMAIAQLVAPCIPQVIPYLSEQHIEHPFTPRWHLDLLGHLTTGMHWHHNEPHGDNPRYITIETLGNTIPFIPAAAVVTLALLAIAGARAFSRHGRTTTFFTIGLIAPAILMYAYGLLTQKYLFYWYFVYLLPALAAFTITGLEATVNTIERRIKGLPKQPFNEPGSPWSKSTRITLIVFFLAFTLLTHPKRDVLRHFSLDPIRESVLLTRPSTDPVDPANVNIITGHLHYSPRIYDANGFEIYEEDPGESRSNVERNVSPALPRLMRWSDSFRVPLYINVGYPLDARNI